MKKIIFFSSVLIFILSCSSFNKNLDIVTPKSYPTPANFNPTIKISIRNPHDKEFLKKIELSLTDLRRNINESVFEVKNHPVYGGKSIKYLGFKFEEVISLIKHRLNVENSGEYIYSIWASDNFSAFISDIDMKTGRAFFAWREIDSSKSKAAQTEDGLWTNIDKHGSPGPFYLVWNNPEKTYWQKWPFKISEITFISKKIVNEFNSLEPDDDFLRTKGYKLVIKNCTSCHKVLGVGFGEMGQDLVELVKLKKETGFIKQIRTPAGRMISFDSNTLSDTDIKAIYLYLKYISQKNNSSDISNK